MKTIESKQSATVFTDEEREILERISEVIVDLLHQLETATASKKGVKNGYPLS
jgi:hypothetical protein